MLSKPIGPDPVSSTATAAWADRPTDLLRSLVSGAAALPTSSTAETRSATVVAFERPDARSNVVGIFDTRQPAADPAHARTGTRLPLGPLLMIATGAVLSMAWSVWLVWSLVKTASGILG